MQYDPNSPIWLQVMTAIKTDIVTGRRPPGEKLPGGRELAVLYTINPNTAARVYQELEREGLCESRRGMGTYVTGDEERIAQVRGTMARQAAARLPCQGDTGGDQPRAENGGGRRRDRPGWQRP